MAVQPITLVIDYEQFDIATTAQMAPGDTSAAVRVAQYGELSVQAIGDATSIVLLGSNDGGVTFAPIGAGVTLTLTAGSSPVTRIAEHPQQIKVGTVTAGTSTKMVLVGRKLK
jgi:hypothetical protein